VLCRRPRRSRTAGQASNVLIHADTLAGKLVRVPLRLIPQESVVPILGSPARGLKWIAGSGPHSNWLGFNERTKRRTFAQHVRAGGVVYDVGANVGSYSLLASILAGPGGHVVAFEPVARNLDYLRRHVELNRLSNVEIVAAAVSDVSGTIRFHVASDPVLGRIDPLGASSVASCTLDDYADTSTSPPPTCIKIDVEGGEAAVLRGARIILSTHRPVVFVATHGDQVDRECRATLQGLGYVIAALPGHDDELLALPAAD
jgi:FkbM family methyltransferase